MSNAANDAAKLTPRWQPTILVVEDDVLIRLALADFLRDNGYQVVEAGSAGEAMSMVEGSVHVDLVVTDIEMPGDLDGLDLARWLRTHRPEVPVIITSGIHVCAEENVVAKPYDFMEVEERIRRLLIRK